MNITAKAIRSLWRSSILIDVLLPGIIKTRWAIDNVESPVNRMVGGLFPGHRITDRINRQLRLEPSWLELDHGVQQ